MKMWEEDCKYITFTEGNFIQVKIFRSNFTGHCFAYVSDAHRGDEFFSGMPDQVVSKLSSIFALDWDTEVLETKIKKFLQDEIKRNKERENV
jgi:hypothetical protein